MNNRNTWSTTCNKSNVLFWFEKEYDTQANNLENQIACDKKR